MNDAGANLLAELRDIHAAPLPPLWPPAPGWWLLALAIIALAAVALWKLALYYRRWQRQQQVLRHLAALHAAWRNERDDRAFAAELSVLLRRAALTRFPRRDVAALSGQQWLHFLDATGGAGQFSEAPGRLLATAPFTHSAEIDGDELCELAQRWLKHNL